jgi:isoleucyl-tRNA synthetase
VQEVIQKVRGGEFEVLGENTIKVGDITLVPGEVEVGFTGKPGLAVESGPGFVVALDTAITPELAVEGLARDLVREIQDMRKEADLHIADRIRLRFSGGADILNAHRDYIMSETLCVEISSELRAPLIEREAKLDGVTVTIGLEKV